MPGSREWPGFRFAVTYHADGNQVRIIKYRSIGMRQAITELASFVDGAWRFRGAMTTDSTRERKLPEKFLHPLIVFALVRIDLRIASVQINRSKYARRAIPGALVAYPRRSLGRDQMR